jgi:ubiquinone/menaquinone biosynthesis C-methylase UbiE
MTAAIIRKHHARLRRGRRIWNLTAATHGFVDRRLGPPLRRMALRHLELQPGQAVLDIGCGTGTMLAAAHEAVGPDGRVVGVDYSPRMLDRARRQVGQCGNVEVREADASRTPLGDNEFDAAVAMASFSAMPDVRAAVEYAHDALRAGGRLFVFDMRLVPTGHLGKRIMTRLMRGIYRATAGFTGADVLVELRRTFPTVHVLIPERSALTMVLATKAT